MELTFDYEVEMYTPQILRPLYTGDSRYYNGYPDVKSSWRNACEVYGTTIGIKKEKMKLADFTKINMSLVRKIKASERVSNPSIEKYLLGRGSR